MSKAPNVGRSWRTHGKHAIIRSLIGQELGVVNHAPRMRGMNRLDWIDLTAGDAALIDGIKWEEGCTPGILASHATNSSKPVLINLHEIQAATYDRLNTNLAEHLPRFGYVRRDDNHWMYEDTVSLYTHNVSGKEASVEYVQRTDAVFVLNDPNAITEWAMRGTFAQEISARTWCFRSLSTMGCNPGGLKRAEKEIREHWFNFPATQEAALPNYRDLLLAAIERDDAQWAYLLSTPGKWRPKTEAVFRTAFKSVGRTVAMHWLGSNKDEYEQLLRKLFLTKTELTGKDPKPKPPGKARQSEAEQLPFDALTSDPEAA